MHGASEKLFDTGYPGCEKSNDDSQGEDNSKNGIISPQLNHPNFRTIA
jgi:hypothetical protein